MNQADAMENDKQIRNVARSIVEEHGFAALDYVTTKANERLSACDGAGVERWRAVLKEVILLIGSHGSAARN